MKSLYIFFIFLLTAYKVIAFGEFYPQYENGKLRKKQCWSSINACFCAFQEDGITPVKKREYFHYNDNRICP